jgi:hypothetical protein
MPASSSGPGVLGLSLVLTVFLILGAGMILVIWHTLSDFMAGYPVDGGRYLLAMALGGLFAGLAWFLARYLQSVLPAHTHPSA